jgi:hypothetical protein
MSNAAKVIAMDAFTSYRTYILLSKTRKAVHMHLNTYIPPRENALINYYYDSQEDFLSAVYAAALHAKTSPFVIVSTVKKQSDTLLQKIRNLCPNANIKSYSSDSTEQDRMDFDNINAAWADVDILIYTSTISAGCSFELPRFKQIFAFFSDQSCDYKTAIQMLGRVRNVESREYHIYCKYSASDLPDTVEEIEHTIATRVEISNIVCNPLEMPKLINATGAYEYTLKDLYYHLHIGNIVHRCQSRNHFSQLFQQCRRESGVQIKKKASGLSEEKVQEVRTKNKKIVDEIVMQQNKAIAEAPGLSDEEAGRLKHEEILTLEQKNSLTAHRLANCYHVLPEVITPEFVKKYNKPKVMSTFSNLNYQVLSQESIADAVNKWRQLQAEEDNSIEDLSRRDNLLKCMFAVDILNGLMSSENKEYCREFN